MTLDDLPLPTLPLVENTFVPQGGKEVPFTSNKSTALLRIEAMSQILGMWQGGGVRYTYISTCSTESLSLSLLSISYIPYFLEFYSHLVKVVKVGGEKLM